MRWRYILKVVGILTYFLGLTMLFPLMVALYYRDSSVRSIIISIGITVFSGLSLHLVCKGEKVENLTKRKAWPS
jgi:Trk-type K+ transport system membrane component